MYYVCMIMRFPRTLSWAWILAPFSASSATISERLLQAAVIRGVSNTKRVTTVLIQIHAYRQHLKQIHGTQTVYIYTNHIYIFIQIYIPA